MRRSRAICLSGIVALLQWTSAAQQTSAPAATFKVDVDYVEVDAVVLDGRGEFVRNLRKDDFTVAENGRTQEISQLSLIDLPIERLDPGRRRAPTLAIEPDVHTNVRDYDGRLYVLMLDDLHTDALRSPHVRQAGLRFVDEYVRPTDLVAVVTASGRATTSQYFTGNARLLRSAIDTFAGRKPRAATLERADEFFSLRRPPEEDLVTARVDDPLLKERGERARSLLERLIHVSESMAALRGRRKALILLSEGIDYDVHNQFDAQYASMLTSLTRDAIAAANRATMAIYAVDPRGVTAMGDQVTELTELPSPEYHRLEIGAGGLQKDLRRAQDSLRTLADGTGGAAAIDGNEHATFFDRIVRESSAYYVLGYYPRDAGRQAGFRKIDVGVRRNGLRVNARPGYMVATPGRRDTHLVDPGGGMPVSLRDALQNPLPLAGLGLTTFAASFKAEGDGASLLVGVEVAGRDLRFEDRDGVSTNAIDLSLAAIDAAGRVAGGTHLTVPMRLHPDARTAVSEQGFRLFSRIAVPIGRYQLRLAAVDRVGARVGSVHQDLEVPDYQQGRLTMSSLLVTSALSRRMPTVNVETLPGDALPAPPTARRVFGVDDGLAVFVEVYDNAPQAAAGIDLVSTLHDESGRVVYRSQPQPARSSASTGIQRYRYGARIPLRALPPGSYVLRVEARAGGDATAIATRATAIRLVTSDSSR